MALSRRGILLGTCWLLVSGCQQSFRQAGIPTTHWPSDSAANPSRGGYRPSTGTVATKPVEAPVVVPGLTVIPRSQWTTAGVGSDINPMAGVNRITIHHAGLAKPITVADRAGTVRVLESIRGGHRGNGWADIGYHYIIDREGNVWEGRSARYQGAHVKDNNEHNIGVMLLGNFDLQEPTSKQAASLRTTVRAIASHYNVKSTAIKSHREINPTRCPGSNLQRIFAGMRSQGAFA